MDTSKVASVNGAWGHVRQPVALGWKPKPDITTFELAQCLPLFNMREPFQAEDYYKTLPDEVKRHIEVSA